MFIEKLPDGLSYVVDPVEMAPELREVKDYWLAKRAGRKMPSRADINPIELRQHLHLLFLVEVVDEAKDFRYRLLGTGVTEMLQRDSTGKTIREVYRNADPEVLQWMLDVYTAVVTRQCPVLRRGTLRVVGKEFIIFESLHLPLSDDDRRVNMIFGRARFSAHGRKAEPRP